MFILKADHNEVGTYTDKQLAIWEAFIFVRKHGGNIWIIDSITGEIVWNDNWNIKWNRKGELNEQVHRTSSKRMGTHRTPGRCKQSA